jgi:ATPase subunit of ABC transporter with duplicated ATPase domains
MKDIYIGYLSQEPQLNPDKDVRGNVQEGFGEIQKILDRYNAINDAFANPDADLKVTCQV